MNIQNLNENWKLRERNAEDYLETKVPSSVCQTYLEHGLMKDPYYRAQENDALKMMEQDYEFSTVFSPDEELFRYPYISIVFEGLDTLADIWLNGKHLGYANNMHRSWEYEVKSVLKEENNELKILFYSPTNYIKEMDSRDGFWPIPTEAMRGTPHIRKSQCMFGWDWGPRLPDIGIFREIKLIGCDTERLDSVYIRQNHQEGKVKLCIDIQIKCMDSRFPLYFGKDEEQLCTRQIFAKIKIVDPSGALINVIEVNDGNKVPEIDINHPELWWPNGLGEQPLYTVIVELSKNGVVVDTFKKRIGLRTLTVRREKDRYGESFAQEVNGVTYFAMGADYIPEDCILSRINKERTRELLQHAISAHYNSIRVWGGGYYPDDFFWDICDELGLVVWIDFMFACGVYRLCDDEFEQNMIEEFIQNIKRIRNHPSLGLWCGNNEMESFYCTNILGFDEDKEFAADYIKLHEYIIPKLVKQYDPETFYWPSSPSSGGGFKDTNSPHKGDVHYWDVWHGNKPFTEYRKFKFRYLSEFGFQSFPSFRTVESFTEPEDRNVFSLVMEKHQRNAAANGKIMNYMEQTYLYPTNFEILLYASQLLQAEAIKYGVEHFRRNRGVCMGTIIWQLNDCWPVASWSSIDYYGRWKALHYYEKRFFAPLFISCEEEGALSQDPNPNAEPYALNKSIKLCVTNDTMAKEKVTVKWELRDNTSAILRKEEKEVIVDAMSCTWLKQENFDNADEYNSYISYRLVKNGEEISSGSVIFTVPKFFKFLNPDLQVFVEQDEIVVVAENYAKSVEIRNEDDDLILSDNFFDMNAGEKRVKILRGKPDKLKVRSVFDIH